MLLFEYISRNKFTFQNKKCYVPNYSDPLLILQLVCFLLLFQDLTSIIRFCLDKAEKLHMQSLSFPAIGTGNLNFPRDLVCMTLLKEIHRFSSRRASRHLKEVFIVVHPTDAQTADVSPCPRACFGTV